MNLAALSIEKRAITYFGILLILAGGVVLLSPARPVGGPGVLGEDRRDHDHLSRSQCRTGRIGDHRPDRNQASGDDRS